jgi:prophage antirepressor-like protein
MSIIRFETIESKLIKYHDEWVLLDKDVAALYEIEPKKLRQQVKRNSDKFPSDYASQLSETDLDVMVSQNVTPSKKHFGGRLPYVFTEKGLYMVATILSRNDNEV